MIKMADWKIILFALLQQLHSRSEKPRKIYGREQNLMTL